MNQIQLNQLIEVLKKGIKPSNTPTTNKWYIDCRRALMDSQSLYLAGNLILDTLNNTTTHVCGITTGAVPLISAVLCAAHQRGMHLSGSFSHRGMNGETRLYGKLGKQCNITLIQDVSTFNDVTSAYIRTIQGFGNIVEVIALVERDGSAKKEFLNRKIDYKAITILTSLAENI